MISVLKLRILKMNRAHAKPRVKQPTREINDGVHFKYKLSKSLRKLEATRFELR